MKNKKIAIIIIFVIAGIILLISRFFEKDTGNKESISLENYYNIKGNEAKVFLDMEEPEELGYIHEGEGYLPLSLARKMVKRLHYEAGNDLMIYTNATEKFVYTVGEKAYTLNGEKKEREIVPFLYQKEEIYVSLEFINSVYEITTRVIPEPNRILIFTGEKKYTTGTVKEKTEIRVEGDKKAKLLGELKENDSIWILDEESNENFDRILSETGILGYILKEKINGKWIVDNTKERKMEEEEYKSIKMEEPIVLAWHQVFNESANRNLKAVLNGTKGVNVISPTWFSIIREDGELSTLASWDYVKEAHNSGIKVWGLVSDFEKTVDFYELFMKEENRSKLIQNLIYFIDEYNLDGINIDFENISPSYAEGYVQFLREFSIVMRERKKVLSIDNYVPAPHTDHYDRREQGILADYICVMAYDEHYFGSPEAGTVSSVGWVRRGIDMMSLEVNPEKLIVGLPFYTRIWKLKQDGKMETKALSMDGGYKRVKDAGAKTSWDSATGQNYAEWKEGGDIFKIWLEDKESLREKLRQVHKSELAGIAFWKLGLESDEVWDSVEEWLEK